MYQGKNVTSAIWTRAFTEDKKALRSEFVESEKRKMQAAADAGAFAGAHEVKRGNTARVDIASKEDARLNSYEHGFGTIQIDVNNPPLSGEFQNNGFVEVIIQQEIPTYFMRVLNFNQATVRARAVAGLLTYSDLCLLALDPDDRAALRVTGNATFGG